MTQSSSALPIGTPSRAAIDGEWRTWSADGTSWTSLDEDKAARPYQHWHLAAELNTPGADDVRRGTVVQKLWNAVDVRVRTLNEVYSLSQIRPIFGLNRKTTTLDVLERLGLVRPLVLRKLKDIRNTVEHQDKGAPKSEECDTLVDIVWYFLRSTDSYVLQRLNYFELTAELELSIGRQSGQFITFDIAEAGWAIRVCGWFQPSQIIATSATSTAGLILELDQSPHVGEDDAIYLSGTTDPVSDLMPLLIEKYFALDLPKGATSQL
jgi:hypothetical protein